uniref:Uncharacterized protein n=1 Tax=Cannabis sativa TaxID=3483 RepID=A0A803NUC6_CANSA
MAGSQTNGDNNKGSFSVGTMNIPLPGNGTTLVDIINGGVGGTTVTPLNLFHETTGHGGETSTPAATVGHFLPITPAMEEDTERRNPRRKAQPQNEVNDVESHSSSSYSRTPSVYTKSGFMETPRGKRYHVHRGDLRDRLNETFRARSQTPQNQVEPWDTPVGDQGLKNGNNPTNVVNSPNAPIATTEVVIPTNIAVVVALPETTQNNTVMPGGVDQSILLRALKIIEQ